MSPMDKELHPRVWLTEQNEQGRMVCLVLEASYFDATAAPLLRGKPRHKVINTYQTTPVADLSEAAPRLIAIEADDDALLLALLEDVDQSWGWLAALPANGLESFAQHWRRRLIFGERPRKALYRFQDNRVLARALSQLNADEVPAYLGPALEVCYWDEAGAVWRRHVNGSPGEHPLPENPAWYALPPTAEQVANVQRENARRYLLAECLDDFIAMASEQEPALWLDANLDLARQWGWIRADQINFLLSSCLQASDYQVPSQWFPRQGESSEEHFQRIQRTVLFAGESCRK